MRVFEIIAKKTVISSPLLEKMQLQHHYVSVDYNSDGRNNPLAAARTNPSA